jgi:hypothetical protein
MIKKFNFKKKIGWCHSSRGRPLPISGRPVVLVVKFSWKKHHKKSCIVPLPIRGRHFEITAGLQKASGEWGAVEEGKEGDMACKQEGKEGDMACKQEGKEGDMACKQLHPPSPRLTLGYLCRGGCRDQRGQTPLEY